MDDHQDRGSIEDLWAAFKRSGSRPARDRLIVHYSPLVKYVAGRVSVGLPGTIEQSDLVSYGIFGLLDAIDKFDPGRQVKFETYAITRIKGAIIDELRSSDWVPRSVRAKARSVEGAYVRLEAELLRTPTDAEVAAELGMTEGDLHEVFNQISFIGLVPLDGVLSGGTGEREKIVLTLYYYEGLTLAEIGDVLGVTESRVCQIHTKAVLQMRSRMLALEREPA